MTEADELEAGKNGAADTAHKDLSAMEDFQGLNVIGKGWSAVAEIALPGGAYRPPRAPATCRRQAQQFLDALGDKVTGDFGSGTVFKTRLVNALLTDDGKVYVGAVTKDALVKAADAAE